MRLHWTLAALLAPILALGLACHAVEAPPEPTTLPASSDASSPGFRDERSFQAHFRKHRNEFGSITPDQYLRLARQLRDAPLSDSVLETVRAVDGVITRFDRQTNHFGAYNPDGTIRTFFIPHDGEAYFRRQAARRPQ